MGLGSARATMTKPFNMLELKARIKTIFRRVENGEKSRESQVIKVRNMTGTWEQGVMIDDREVSLTARSSTCFSFLSPTGARCSTGEAA